MPQKAQRLPRSRAEPRANSEAPLAAATARLVKMTLMSLRAVWRPAFGGRILMFGCLVLTPPRSEFPLRLKSPQDNGGMLRRFQDARGGLLPLRHPKRREP